MRTTLIRAGGPFGNQNGAMSIEPRDGPLAVGNIFFQDIDIEDSTFSGVEFRGPNAMSNVSLSGITVSAASTWGVAVDANANGTVTMSGVVVNNPASGEIHNPAGGAFDIVRGTGNVGW